jgi:hypothetical protein
MKTFFLLLGLCVTTPAVIAAQGTIPNTPGPDSTGQVDNKRVGRLLTFRDLDQRRVYNWKNGQRSTAAGRQAETKNAKYVRVWGDSAMVVRNPKKEYQ